MNLYNKDYKVISDAVQVELNLHNEIKNKRLNGDFELQHSRYSNELYRVIDLFPNNFVKFHNDWDKEELTRIYHEIKDLIDTPSTTERDVLNFINQNEYYCIMSSLFRYYNFGHHGMYLFKEFPLGGTYVADYLLIGRSSFGLSFIFIELENIYENITIASGHLGETIRKGVNQVVDWKTWLDSNFTNLREKFHRQKGDHINLPQELTDYDSTRMNFMVIGGRRVDYNETTYRLRRENESNRINILHYDNLADSMLRLITPAPYNFEE